MVQTMTEVAIRCARRADAMLHAVLRDHRRGLQIHIDGVADHRRKIADAQAQADECERAADAELAKVHWSALDPSKLDDPGAAGRADLLRGFAEQHRRQ